ncbi:MAG: DUF481 domain-containing protein [Planctomycetota bacterium]|jgi:putative salt-induced outer membrane protein YdiY
MKKLLVLLLFGSCWATPSLCAQDLYEIPYSRPAVPSVGRVPPRLDPGLPFGPGPQHYPAASGTPPRDPLPLITGSPPPVASMPVLTENIPEPPPAIWECWDGNVELGLDGSEGNSQRFNFRFGVEAERKTKYHSVELDLDFHKNATRRVETANRTFLDWRYERLFDESPWTWFVHGTVDYDEFRAFDVQVAVDTGLGYHFIRTDATSLVGRVGGGWRKKIGGPGERDVPEAVFGTDFEHQLTTHQKVSLTVDYMPDVTAFGDYRINAKAGWETVLDEEMNLSLKLSVLDRYDSMPDGAKPNDADYTATLLWSF